MLRDADKTKEQLINELSIMRQKVDDLEKSEIQRMQVETELRHINSTQSLILNNNIMGIGFVRNRIFEWVNPKLPEMIGMTLDQVQGASTRIIYSSDEAYEEKGRAAYTAMKTGEWFEFQIDIPRANGTTFIGRIVGKALNPSLPQEGSIWIFEDITKRKETESALSESEAKYRLLVDNSYDLIWTMTADGVFTYVSPSWQRTLGYEPCYITGKKFHLIVHPDDVAICEEYLQKAISTRQQMPGPEYRVMHANGSWRWHTASGTPVFSTDGAFISFVGISRDITEHKHTEEALKEGERILHDIIQGSPIPAFIIGKDHRVMYWNKALELYSTIKAADIVGTNNHWRAFYDQERPCMADLLVDGEIELIPQWYAGKYSRSEVIDGAFEVTDFFPHMHGGTWLYFTATPIRDADGAIIGAVETLTDVTERKRAEKDTQDMLNFLQTIIETIPSPLFYKDTTGIYRGCNKAFEDFLGLSKEEIIGKSVYDISPHDLADRYQEMDRALFSQPGKQVYEHQTTYSDGSRRDVIFNKATYLNANGSLAGLVGVIVDITDRKQSENALRESQRQLSDIIGFLPDATIVIDKDGNIIAWNRATEIMTGVKSEEMLGKGNYEYAIPFYGDRRPILIDLALNPDPEREKQYTTLQRKGDILFGEAYTPKLAPGNVHLSATASVLRDSRGDTIGAIECIRNNTERKQMEDALRESERRLADIIDFLPDAAVVIDKDGKVAAWNKAMEHMTGVKAEDIIGKGDYEYALPFYGERRPILIDLALQPAEEVKKKYVSVKWHGNVLVGEAYMPNLRGGKVYMLGTASPLYDTKGTIVGAIETIRDITERRQMEEALLAEGARLASILDGTPVPAFVIDRDRKVILWNRSNENYTGKTKTEMLGKTIDLEFLHRGKHVPSVAELMLAMTDDEIIKKYGHAGVKKSDLLADALEVIGNIWLRGEERIMSIQAKRIAGPGDEIIGVIQTAQDVTERVRLETQFRQAQKMEAIGTLAGGIAHDFNNILGAIMGYTELYKEQVRDRPKVYHSMEEVLKAVNRAKDLVQQILTFSRRTQQEKRPTTIIPIVKEVAKFIRASLPTTIEIKQSLNVTSDVIMADATQVHQVLMNLCTNAGQAMMEKGGVLEIGLEEVFIGKEERGRFSSLASGRYLKLNVCDTGQGINTENLEKIFEPYFTTKGKGEGTGLGLAVVHGIIKDHGGEIKVYSEIGKGSVFSVYLPLLEKRADKISSAAEAPLPGGSETILFIDDENMLATLGKLSLEELGYKVVAETDPVKAIEEFRNDKDTFDLVITDKTMPHLTGYDVARELRKIRADIPIILCSGFQEKEDLEKQSTYDISFFIIKPIGMHILAKSIRSILDKKC